MPLRCFLSLVQGCQRSSGESESTSVVEGWAQGRECGEEMEGGIRRITNGSGGGGKERKSGGEEDGQHVLGGTFRGVQGRVEWSEKKEKKGK